MNLTAEPPQTKLLPALFEEQPDKDQRTVDSYFKRLRRNETIALTVVDPRLPRLSRIPHAPVLFIAPLSVYGGPSDKLMLALQGYGCEIVDTHTALGPLSVARLGLRMSLAAALADAINRTFGGKKDGQTSTEKGSSSKGASPRKNRRRPE